ncbi:MAG TPA: transposase [Nitrososphaerales archaeon]|nr:transposase [Nitrososphaerales archaeon]
MCNDAIRIAVREKPRSRFTLMRYAYAQLKKYGLHTHYILSACEVAYSAYKNKNRESSPHLKKPFLKLDNQSYQLNHLLLRIPTSSRHFVFLTLHGSDYHLALIDDPKLRKGSLTITDRTVGIALSKEVELIKPSAFVGIDINEKNVTISAPRGFEKRFGELGAVVETKEVYREIRAKIGRAMKRDIRTRKKLLAKYGRRERNRTAQGIHKITKQIVNFAKENRLGIKMEKLKGIRRLYQKGNGQGPFFRSRMNTWVFGEVQRQIGYKAAWLGIPTYYVSPRGTSSYCLCGSRVVPMVGRKLYCQKCNTTWDRDVLASINIMACAVPQDRLSRGSNEGERGDEGSNPQSRWREA